MLNAYGRSEDMKRIKHAVVIVICCISVAGCCSGEGKSVITDGKATNSASMQTEGKPPDSFTASISETSSPVPEYSSPQNASSATIVKPNIYDKTYVYNDREFNNKAVIFRILKLDTKKTYQVTADEERMHLLDVVWNYFDDLAKQKGLAENDYFLDDLEYVYELKDQLLYMPVYFKYCGNKRMEKEELYNLVIRENGTMFELIGQTDRALLNEEQYPKQRINTKKKGKEEKTTFTVNETLYDHYWINGKRIEESKVRNVFLKQMENHVKSALTKEDKRWKVRIGMVDVVQNEKKDYFALMEVVFYNTDDTVRKVNRYQVLTKSGTLETFEFHDLGVYDNIIAIPVNDYVLRSCKTLYEQAKQEELDFVNDIEQDEDIYEDAE